jgi:PAS domain S-box-containing protein
VPHNVNVPGTPTVPDEPIRLRRIVIGYLASTAVLGASLFVVPQWRALAWGLAGLLGVVAIVVGVRVNAPRLRNPWWLLAGAIIAMATGDILFEIDPESTVAEVGYLAMFPLVGYALIQLTTSSVVLRERSRLLGLLTLTVAAALLCWMYVISPSLDADHLTGADRSVLAAYVLGDLLILLTAVRLLFAARHSAAVIALTLGAVGVLVADLSYALAEIGSGWRSGSPAELGYLMLDACWGVAALHPSMVELTAPAEPRARGQPRRWVWLIGISVVIPSTVLLVESMTDRVRDGVIIAVASLLISLLVFTHLTDTINGYWQSLTRERELCNMCAALVSAAESAEVVAAVGCAVARLIPAGTPHGVLLAVDDRYGAAATYSMDADRRTRMAQVRALHPLVQTELGRFDDVLVCPLVPDHFGVGSDPIGSLYVAADAQALDAARDAVEVLAAQATLALERILLTDAMNQRDSERYLRTVVRNTTDVVLVVDSDERIRYASPSLVEVLGIAPPVSGLLRDIVDPDDHGVVRQTLSWSGEPDRALDTWSLVRPDGTPALVEVTSRDLRKDRMVRGYVITMRDVTERIRLGKGASRRLPEDSPAGQNRRSATKKFQFGAQFLDGPGH